MHPIYLRKWLRNHPRIFLFKNLFDCTALYRCGSNKVISFSLKHHRPDSIDRRSMHFKSGVPMVFSSPLTLPADVFHSDWLPVSIHGNNFSLHFS